MSLSRRELFGFRRPRTEAPADAVPAASPPEPAAPAPSYSLDGFYRDRSPPRALPVFAVRTSAAVATTRVGAGSSSRPEAAAATGAPMTVPAGMVPSVLTEACLATRSFCSVCFERCPRPGALLIERGRPRVVAEACDGCGRCIAVCPAPVLAFALVARGPMTAGGS